MIDGSSVVKERRSGASTETNLDLALVVASKVPCLLRLGVWMLSIAPGDFSSFLHVVYMLYIFVRRTQTFHTRLGLIRKL